MSNYNESVINGTKWQRCSSVTIRNPYGGIPVIHFDEDIVMNVEGSTIILGKSVCNATFDAVNGVINLIDPITGVSLGTTCTHIELYTILYSLYIQTALLRDNPPS